MACRHSWPIRALRPVASASYPFRSMCARSALVDRGLPAAAALLEPVQDVGIEAGCSPAPSPAGRTGASPAASSAGVTGLRRACPQAWGADGIAPVDFSSSQGWPLRSATARAFRTLWTCRPPLVTVCACDLQPWIGRLIMKRYLALALVALSLGGTLALGLSIGLSSPVLAGTRIG